MSHLGGLHRTPSLPHLSKEASDLASRILNIKGEHFDRDIEDRVDRLHKRLDEIYEYLQTEREAIAANYDELATRINELPEMNGLWFFQDNVAADQVAVSLSDGRTTRGYCAPEEGSIITLAVRSNEARTAGTLTLEAYINGVATGLTVVLDATNTTFNSSRQPQGTSVFKAGDAISLRITTNNPWAPVTADIICAIGVVLTGVG